MKNSDYIHSTQNRRIGLLNQPNSLFLFILFLFGTILSRLFWIQIFQGSYYRKLSNENRIRLVSSEPIRGRLLDSKGNTLADNRLVYSLTIQPRLIDENRWPDLRNRLSTLMDLKINDLDRSYKLGLLDDPFRITLASELSNQQVLRFKENESSLIGSQVDIQLIRYYPYRELAAHVLGYTQLITAQEYKYLSKKGYQITDRIGRSGVEASYEDHLRGKWGGEMLEVDATGVVQRSLGIRSPQAGQDLSLTIDLDLQLAAEQALDNKRAGAIVVLDPRDGAIRAMASRPNYDPNFFSKSFTSQKEYDRLFLSSQMPLFSRATNAYDPGSTWKIVTGMAGMESGKFPPNTLLKTASCLQYGSHCFPEHNGEGFGIIGYQDALRLSSNTFFYQIGVGVGSKELYQAAIKLGFNSLTGVEISSQESKGLVGDEEWATKGRGWALPGTTPWIPEDIASASIGQAVIQVTPLQLARAYSVFANGGYLITPHLARLDVDWTSGKFKTKVDIQDSTLKTIREGLRKVVQSGTGMRIKFNVPNLPPVAGKTGTAEDSTGGPDHAWFACFAPYENTEIVIIAFAQNTPGGGSVHALPMAKKVLEKWNLLRDG